MMKLGTATAAGGVAYGSRDVVWTALVDLPTDVAPERWREARPSKDHNRYKVMMMALVALDVVGMTPL